MTPAPERRRLTREVALLYGATLLVSGGLSLAQTSIGWLRGYVLVLVAATFLYLPLEYLHRKGLDPADFGVHRRALGRGLKVALLVMLITFPPYLVGYHLWQTQWLGNRLAPAEARYDRWPVELEDAPRVAALQAGEVRLYAVDEALFLRWHLPAGQRFEATVESDAPVRATGGVGVDGGVRIAGGSDGAARLEVPGSRLRLDVEAGGDRLPADRLRLGTALAPADDVPYEAQRGWFWLLNLILVQLLLVALPEEVFYRGYLQTRLDAVVGTERRVLGVPVNVASVIATSALFAIGHIVTVPSPHRLAVFFPSLLFGWMRRAGGGIAAPVLFHAACNLLVDVVSRLYAA
ncbi:MAG: CPBP family intramembrane metalloprotease [Myxococcales bacterium]|nr:CPBP family intramembrane metalloprotease [Myxococcales bacterium]